MPFYAFFLSIACLFTACSTVNRQQFNSEIGVIDCDGCPLWHSYSDTLAFVNEVRQFVAQNVPTGKMNNALCDTFGTFSIAEFPTNTYLHIFRKKEGVGTCGLAANMMVNILLKNKIDAYTYNFGFEHTALTHVVVLVKLAGKLLVFDPFMNYELLDENRQNLGLMELLAAVQKQALRVQFSTDSVLANSLIDLRLLHPKYAPMLNQPSCTALMQQPLITDSILYFKSYRSFGHAADTACYSFVKIFTTKLRAETEFTQFHEGMLLKIAPIAGAADGPLLNARIDSALAHLQR